MGTSSATEIADIPAIPAQKAKVLLVDDRSDKLLALGAIFEGVDLELVTANSGKEALRLLLIHEFAVILLDVIMPGMDGFETASLIRQRKSSEHTPIIFITAMNSTDTHASRGYSLGAVDYIFAPVIPEVLRAKVTVFIDLFKMRNEIERRSNELRHEAEQRAEHLETRLESLLNRLHVGVFRVTLEGDLISANPAFFGLYGINPLVDPRSINLKQFYINVRDREEIIEELRRTGRVHEHHSHQRRFDHRPIWVSISKTLVSDADGRMCIDGLVEDITVRKESETALIEKAEELARSNAELEEFAYVASHDLQEPLRMVSTYSSLIDARYGPGMDDHGRMYLRQVVDGSKRMQTLIRDILIYSQLGRNWEASKVDCNEVLERVRYNLQTLIEEAHVEISYGQLPNVHGDPVLIGQVFQNLLSNAIKFRRPEVDSRISISAECNGPMWNFAISDNGIGIQPEYHKRIFGVFNRLHGREEYEGTGIGLAICRKAVHRHGGDIHLQSTPGVGSTFFFTLPTAD